MDALNQTQQSAVAQLRDLTNGDEDVAISVLQTVDFDVERAAELIFGTAPPPPAGHGRVAPVVEEFDIDDSEQRHHGQPVVVRPTHAWSISVLFTWPFQLLSSLLRFILGILRVPLPRPFAFNLALFRPRRTSPPRGNGGADRWVRELEEETGARSLSASGIETSPSAGPSTLTHRPQNDRKVLPDFTLGTYEEALRTCQRDLRVGCIVLVSEEHDDVPEFKRSTLTDSTFVRLLTENNVLVWGGDVRDREAYSAGLKLQATTYPFVAFLALQPRRGSSSTSSPVLTVLSRHQGSPAGPTSANTLANHLENQVLPRVTPFLGSLRAVQHAAAADRALREEQGRAFREAALRDTAKIQAAIEEEKRAKQERIERINEAARIAQEAEVKEKMANDRLQWRAWTRAVVEQIPEDRDGIRLAMRLPDGRRLVRKFDASRSLTFLYTFVDAHLSDLNRATTTSTSPDGHGADNLERAMEEQIDRVGDPQSWWGFQLMLAYPRQEISWRRGALVGQIESLKGGGQLVVQMNSLMVEGEADEEGYISED